MSTLNQMQVGGVVYDIEDSAAREEAIKLKDDIGDAWTSGKTYAVGDYCISDNRLYKCKTAHTAGISFSADYWDAINLSSDKVSFSDAVTFDQALGGAVTIGKIASADMLYYMGRGIIGRDLLCYRTSGGAPSTIRIEFSAAYGSQNLSYLTFMAFGDGFLSYGRAGNIVNLGTKNITAEIDTNNMTVTFSFQEYSNFGLLISATDFYRYLRSMQQL